MIGNDFDEESQLDATSILLTSPINGTLINNNDGTVTYTHDGSETLSDSFTYTISDLDGLVSNSATVRIIVTPVNDIPIAVDDNANVSEGGSVSINVIANDSDAENSLNLLSIVLSSVNHGTLINNNDGAVTYTHDGSETLSDSFTYTISDLDGLVSNSATVSITVTPVNDIPIAVDDIANVSEGGSVSINLIANDSDAENSLNLLSIVLSSANHGTLVNNNNGTITYTHNGSDTTIDSFSYTVADLSGAISNTATVNINITPQNDAPVINSQNPLVINEDESVVIDLSYLTVTDPDNSYPTGFRVVIEPDVNYSFIGNAVSPVMDFHGQLIVKLRVSDGSVSNNLSSLFLLQITVSPINDAPLAIKDGVYTAENTSVNINVLQNDNDSKDPLGGINDNSIAITQAPKHGSAILLPNHTINYTPYSGFSGSDTLIYRVFDLGYPLPALSDTALVVINVARLSPETHNDVASTSEDVAVIIDVLSNDTDSGNDINPATLRLVTLPLNGTATITATNRISYLSNPNFNGADWFSYTVRDFTNLISNTSRVDITVIPVNDPPVAVNYSVNSRENAVANININDFCSDVDGNIDYASVAITKQPTHGTVSYDFANKRLVYTPVIGYVGIDFFNITIADLVGVRSAVSVITINISNQAPTANDDAVTINEDETAQINVALNDTDPQNNLNVLSVQMTSLPLHGTATVNSLTGVIQYSPVANYFGADEFEYKICDLDGYCDNAKVVITILSVNDLPVAINKSVQTNEDVSVVFTISNEVSDIDGFIKLSSLSLVSNPSHGTLLINSANGELQYAPALNYFGLDQFTYSVCDNSGGCTTGLVNIQVQSVNDAPNAVADVFDVIAGSAVLLNVTANDFDIDGTINPSSISIVLQPSLGTVTKAINNQLVYTSNASFVGTDVFTYRICDMEGACSQAIVTLHVTSGNIAPVANDDNIIVPEDKSVTIYPLTNDVDVNINPLALSIISQPVNGTIVVNLPSQSITYFPNANYFGSDLIVYQICDRGQPPLCDQASIFIEVSPVNDAPVTVNDVINVTDGNLSEVNVLLNDTDIDSPLLTTKLIGAIPAGITAVLTSKGLLTIMPDLGLACGEYMLKYQLCDNESSCAEGSVTIVLSASDSDNDGIPDWMEGRDTDSDKDGIVNALDLDSDNDSIPDLVEGGVIDLCVPQLIDSDNDGVYDYLDLDSDNDGISDLVEGTEDCDNDVVPNYRDYFDNCSVGIKSPEIFTPNGDRVNDFFVIPAASEYPQNKFVVINRWGLVVFEAANYINNWDGRSSDSSLGSNVLPEGTYYYVFKSSVDSYLIKGIVYIKY